MADSLAQHEELSPLQQEVLDEYDRLSSNMKKVSRLPSVSHRETRLQSKRDVSAAAHVCRVFRLYLSIFATNKWQAINKWQRKC